MISIQKLYIFNVYSLMTLEIMYLTTAQAINLIHHLQTSPDLLFNFMIKFLIEDLSS
jgi:hypothetical protein